MNRKRTDRDTHLAVADEWPGNSHANGSERGPQTELDNLELHDWLESYDYVVQAHGPERAAELLNILRQRAQTHDVPVTLSLNTPFINTIPVDRQPPFPGDREIERRIKSLVRWNALAMVVRANRRDGAHRRPHCYLRFGGHAL